jgi:hypothetical protein
LSHSKNWNHISLQIAGRIFVSELQDYHWITETLHVYCHYILTVVRYLRVTRIWFPISFVGLRKNRFYLCLVKWDTLSHYLYYFTFINTNHMLRMSGDTLLLHCMFSCCREGKLCLYTQSQEQLVRTAHDRLYCLIDLTSNFLKF